MQYDKHSNIFYSECIMGELNENTVSNQGYHLEVKVKKYNYPVYKKENNVGKIYLQIQFFNSKTREKSTIIDLRLDTIKSGGEWKYYFSDFLLDDTVNYNKIIVGYIKNNPPIDLDYSCEKYVVISKVSLWEKEDVPPENQVKRLLRNSYKVFFENNKSELSSKEEKALYSILEKVISLKIDSINITGHADENGSYDYNLKLSIERAENIKHLIKNKLKNDDIVYITKGESYSISKKMNWKEKGRRVEFQIHLKNNELIPWYTVSSNCSSAQQLSYIGDIRKASVFNNDPLSLNIKKSRLKSIDKKALDAKKFIFKKSNDVDIIMINEAHHIPFHRKFAMDLLDTLYKNGYRYLAVEALANANDINSLSYKEPFYKAYLEKAKKLGFHLISYDSDFDKKWEPEKEGIDTSLFSEIESYDISNDKNVKMFFNSSQNKRDYNQYLNLKKYLDSIDENHKMIIHCGYGHLATKRMGYWYPLGYYLKKEFGDKLLSIDQVFLNDCQNRAQNDLIKLIKPYKSVIPTDKSGMFGLKRFDPLTSKYIKPFEVEILHQNDKFKPKISNTEIDLDFLEPYYLYPIMVIIYDIYSNPLTDIAFNLKEIKSMSENNRIAIPSNKRYKIVVKDRNNKIIYYGIKN